MTATTHDTRRRGFAATARRIAVELTPQTIEQIATRVTQLLQHQQTHEPNPASTTRLLTVKELAHHLHLNPSWVYEHADQLGAIRTGTGPKARIRFNPHTATQALTHHNHHQGPPTPVPRARATSSRPTPYPADTPLLKARDPYTPHARSCLAPARPRHRLAATR